VFAFQWEFRTRIQTVQPYYQSCSCSVLVRRKRAGQKGYSAVFVHSGREMQTCVHRTRKQRGILLRKSAPHLPKTVSFVRVYSYHTSSTFTLSSRHPRTDIYPSSFFFTPYLANLSSSSGPRPFDIFAETLRTTAHRARTRSCIFSVTLISTLSRLGGS